MAKHDAYEDVIFASPTVQCWTRAVEERLTWLREAFINMSDTAVGRKQALEKRNLFVAARNINAEKHAEVLEAFGMSSASQN